ncbi:MAG TPA: hypothetical protein VF711_11350, partial [Acidimicrobiales bacterium]
MEELAIEHGRKQNQQRRERTYQARSLFLIGRLYCVRERTPIGRQPRQIDTGNKKEEQTKENQNRG